MSETFSEITYKNDTNSNNKINKLLSIDEFTNMQQLPTEHIRINDRHTLYTKLLNYNNNDNFLLIFIMCSRQMQECIDVWINKLSNNIENTNTSCIIPLMNTTILNDLISLCPYNFIDKVCQTPEYKAHHNKYTHYINKLQNTHISNLFIYMNKYMYKYYEQYYIITISLQQKHKDLFNLLNDDNSKNNWISKMHKDILMHMLNNLKWNYTVCILLHSKGINAFINKAYNYYYMN